MRVTRSIPIAYRVRSNSILVLIQGGVLNTFIIVCSPYLARITGDRRGETVSATTDPHSACPLSSCQQGPARLELHAGVKRRVMGGKVTGVKTSLGATAAGETNRNGARNETAKRNKQRKSRNMKSSRTNLPCPLKHTASPFMELLRFLLSRCVFCRRGILSRRQREGCGSST